MCKHKVGTCEKFVLYEWGIQQLANTGALTGVHASFVCDDSGLKIITFRGSPFSKVYQAPSCDLRFALIQ